MRADPCSLRLFASGLLLCTLTACGGGGGGGGSSSQFAIDEVSNGFGRLLPYLIAVPDAAGGPTNEVVEIRSVADLLANVRRSNPVRRPTTWPETAILPNSLSGNHFLMARFTQVPDATTVLSRDAADAPGTLGAGIQIQVVDRVNGQVTPVPGRAFLGGATFGPAVDPADASRYLLQDWVAAANGALQALPIGAGTPGLGFPGTEPGTTFSGDLDLVAPAAFVFVVDSDGDFTTHERFPDGQLQIRIGEGVRSARGRSLQDVGFVSSTVGPDTIPPEVQVLFPTGNPDVQPPKAALDVDPATNVIVQFTEAVQINLVGDPDDGTTPALSPSIQLTFGPSSARVSVPFTVRPLSPFDMSRYELAPTYDFPGTGPEQVGIACGGSFGRVNLAVNAAQLADLSNNRNTQTPTSFFTTREGTGLVNAPVTPDAVYIGRTGSFQGISVIDLNGFGQGTGNPTYDIQNPAVEGNSNFPNNPNVALNGALLVPPLTQGDCTFNGGSSGPFTLVKDSSLRDIVAGPPQLESVGDMAIGHALDNTFNNEEPFGCQAGGGNICAQSGLKRISIIPGGPFTVASANIAPVAPFKTDNGVENLASWAPHPNPPPLVFPPICLSPLINAMEPTSIVTTCLPTAAGGCLQTYGPPFSALGGPTVTNLLVPGPFPLGIPAIGLPPQSTLSAEQNAFFEGPATAQPNIGLCQPYMVRQQVGHFLYVVDRVAGEIVVFNSNRFTVLDRIPLPDPTALAMSPNLDFLAVTNEGADQVAFIDIAPSSATFHQVIKTTTVGTGPTAIAWETSNEDIFVCNQGEGTVSVISGFTLDVRKILRNQLSRPIEVVLSPRQTTFGFIRGVYFGYILNQNGTVAIFESGPDGINGFGFDDVIASLPFSFQRPKTMQLDVTNLNSAVWIVHENPLDQEGRLTGQGGGAISSVGVVSGTLGAIPLDPGPFIAPNLRELTFGVLSSFGEGPGGLSGIPVDIAFDNLRNLSALTNYGTTFSPGNLLNYNGKSNVKLIGFAALPTNNPQFMFAAVPNPGVVDVFDAASGASERVDTNPYQSGTQSIPAPNASVLMDYFRQ
jgi:hypothetical protein